MPLEEAVRFDVLEGLIIAVDTKDHYTRRHSEDVARYAAFLAAELGLDEGARSVIYRAGRLHDIGKIGVPDHILRKPGPLTEAEYEIVKQHVALGDLIVRELPDLEEIRAGIRHHHERWDGKGYLHGLAGDDIPEIARILAVCDAFSAMTTTRSYRKALSVDEALTRLEDACGSQLDERLVIAFVNGIRTVATAPLARGRARRPLDAEPSGRDDRSRGRLRCPPRSRCIHGRFAAWSSRSSVLVASMIVPSTGLAAAPPALGTADDYAIVANTTITNTGVSLIAGNLALVGPSVTGMGGVVTGRSDIGNAAAARAEDDVLSAHHDATGSGPGHGDVGRRSRRQDPRPRRLPLRVLGRAARNADPRWRGCVQSDVHLPDRLDADHRHRGAGPVDQRRRRLRGVLGGRAARRRSARPPRCRAT